MEKIYVEATAKTPMVSLDPVSGVFEFKGKSIPSDAENFYAPIIDWVESYAGKPASKTVINVDLDFFNISSSKRLLFIMYKLNEMTENGHDVELKWHYYNDDDDMYEVGQDYAFMVKIPFEFVIKERALLAV